MMDSKILLGGIALGGLAILFLSRKTSGENGDENGGYNLSISIVNAPLTTTHFEISLCDINWNPLEKLEEEQYISIGTDATFLVPDTAGFPLLVVYCQGVYPTPGNPSSWTQAFYFQSFNPAGDAYVVQAIIEQSQFEQKDLALDISQGIFFPR